jgi:hypothetical protein
MVNVLIALVADPSKHSGLEKLTQEAIDLLAPIRQDGLYDSEDSERHARRPWSILLQYVQLRKGHRPQLGSSPSNGIHRELLSVQVAWAFPVLILVKKTRRKRTSQSSQPHPCSRFTCSLQDVDQEMALSKVTVAAEGDHGR